MIYRTPNIHAIHINYHWRFGGIVEDNRNTQSSVKDIHDLSANRVFLSS